MNAVDLKKGCLVKFYKRVVDAGHGHQKKDFYSYAIYLGMSESYDGDNPDQSGWWYRFAIQATGEVYNFGLSTITDYTELVNESR